MVVIESKTKKNNSLNKSQVRISKTNGNQLTLEDIEEIYDNLMEQGFSSERIAIIGMNAERLTTIVSRDENAVFNFADEDYMKNKPEAIRDKLSNFDYVQVLIYSK